MGRIILTHDPSPLEVSGRAFAVVAPGYSAPSGMKVVDVNELMVAPMRWIRGDVTMVVVGLSKLMTPGNRVRLGRVLLRPYEGLTRISIDRQLFVSDPWRMWWHFYAVGHERWGFTDSFLAESRWKMAHEQRTEDPFGVPKVLDAMRDVVEVRDAFRFGAIDVEVRHLSEQQHAAYARLKEEAFTHERSIAAIIKRLAAFAQEACPERSIPSPARLFQRPPSRIVRTDLGVDRYLVEQLMSRVELTNAIAGG